jgi:hypothetical protein
MRILRNSHLERYSYTGWAECRQQNKNDNPQLSTDLSVVKQTNPETRTRNKGRQPYEHVMQILPEFQQVNVMYLTL